MMITLTVDTNEESAEGYFWLLSYKGALINSDQSNLLGVLNLVEGMRIYLEQDGEILFTAELRRGYIHERRSTLWYAIPVFS